MFRRQPTLTATDIEHIVRRELSPLYKLMEKLMTKVDDEAAAIAANTAMITQIGTNLTAVMEGHATIQEEIDALKAAIGAAGTPVDFTPLDNAVATQTTALQAVAAMVTPAAPPAAPAAPAT